MDLIISLSSESRLPSSASLRTRSSTSTSVSVSVPLDEPLVSLALLLVIESNASIMGAVIEVLKVAACLLMYSSKISRDTTDSRAARIP